MSLVEISTTEPLEQGTTSRVSTTKPKSIRKQLFPQPPAGFHRPPETVIHEYPPKIAFKVVRRFACTAAIVLIFVPLLRSCAFVLTASVLKLKNRDRRCIVRKDQPDPGLLRGCSAALFSSAFPHFRPLLCFVCALWIFRRIETMPARIPIAVCGSAGHALVRPSRYSQLSLDEFVETNKQLMACRARSWQLLEVDNDKPHVFRLPNSAATQLRHAVLRR